MSLQFPGSIYCPWCEEHRPQEAFGYNWAAKSGRSTYCLRCRADIARQRRAAGLDQPAYRPPTEADRARAAVSQAVKRGTFHRPARCSKCGLGRELEAHHYRGYERKHWFAVHWLCASCHRLEHTRVTARPIRRAA